MVIGVTGGIGCGKTTFAKLLSFELKAPILDADKIAHEAYFDKDIIIKICETFGNDILDETNNINKSKLSNIVFSNSEKLSNLNAIIHPFVINSIITQIASLSQNYKYIIVDIPLPVDEFIKLSDFIITVWANLDIRIKRVMERTNLSESDVVNRIKKQMPQDKYEALADYIVYNNNSIDELKNKVKDILSKLI